MVANPNVWVQQVLEEKFPGHVIKDVSAKTLPSWYIQHHTLYGSDNIASAEHALYNIQYSWRLRIYAPDSMTAHDKAMEALGAIQQAVWDRKEYGGLTPVEFTVGQMPIENFKVSSIKGVLGAQMDCTFFFRVYVTPKTLYGDTVKW